ncbi:MAG: hypothetical protein WBC22_06725 [Sedimentisphaerales bacterium]
MSPKNFLDIKHTTTETITGIHIYGGLPGGYNKSDLNCNSMVDFNNLDISTLQWLGSVRENHRTVTFEN